LELDRRSTHAGALAATAWLPAEDLDAGEWMEHGRRLGVIGRGVGWWIGDWLRYGNLKFGERYVRAAKITGYDVQTLMNMVYVASAYAVQDRRESLSFSHHAELAALDPEERAKWLDLAEADRLSVRCLREEMRRARRGLAAGRSAPALAAGTPARREASKRCPHCGHAVAAQAVVTA
jgi:hypothetical protein